MIPNGISRIVMMTTTPSSGWITMFGKTRYVKTTIYNIEENTPEPAILWVEREEDYYAIPLNETIIVVKRNDFVTEEQKSYCKTQL